MVRNGSRYYPFTIPGTVLAAAVFYLLGAGYSRRNPYALFLSLAALMILVVLIVLTRIQAYRLSKKQIIWDSSAALYGGGSKGDQRFSIPGFRTWFFFRVHVRITGVLTAGNGCRYSVLRERSFTGDDILEIPLGFTFSGTFSGKAVITVQDIFGLVRAGIPHTVSRTIPVLPSLLKEQLAVHPDAAGGEDDTRPRRSSDNEKYYMREYMPGDRFRDVNWKATSKVGEMITRISPVTEEETRLIIVDFRHFAADGGKGSREHVAHLEYVKKWFITFLWQIKQLHPDYSCIVYTGRGAFPVEEVSDIQRLSVAVSALFFEKDPLLPREVIGISEVYVFTTPFDKGLTAGLRQYEGKKITLFTTSFPGKKEKDADVKESGENVHIFAVFPGDSQLHLPGLWSLRRIDTSAYRNGTPGMVKSVRKNVEIGLL